MTSRLVICASASHFLPHIIHVSPPSSASSCCRGQRCEAPMADKEATVYIIDMGKSMGEKRNAREVSDLDWAMIYVWEKITSTVGRFTRAFGGPN